MTLSDLRGYLIAAGKAPVSLWDLVQHFRSSADALEPMLDFWIAKGCVQKSQKTPACGVRCQACHPLSTVCYQWETS